MIFIDFEYTQVFEYYCSHTHLEPSDGMPMQAFLMLCQDSEIIEPHGSSPISSQQDVQKDDGDVLDSDSVRAIYHRLHKEQATAAGGEEAQGDVTTATAGASRHQRSAKLSFLFFVKALQAVGKAIYGRQNPELLNGPLLLRLLKDKLALRPLVSTRSGGGDDEPDGYHHESSRGSDGDEEGKEGEAKEERAYFVRLQPLDASVCFLLLVYLCVCVCLVCVCA